MAIPLLLAGFACLAAAAFMAGVSLQAILIVLLIVVGVFLLAVGFAEIVS
jgi:hypothetical protein